MTIRDFMRQGMTSFHIYCTTPGCCNERKVTFESTGLRGDVPFTDIPERRRLVCSRCGRRSMSVFPNWPELTFYGAGWMADGDSTGAAR
jgi:hypothetical protein